MHPEVVGGIWAGGGDVTGPAGREHGWAAWDGRAARVERPTASSGSPATSGRAAAQPRPWMGGGRLDAWLGILRRSCSHGGMPHIHEKIDFTVAVFVVDRDKVLLVHHRRLGRWLPLGGHVELDEDPEQAAHREVMEESGLAVELLGERPPTTEPGTRALIAPRFLDIHRISDTHEHIGLIYLARPRSGSTRLAPEEHHAIRWCSRQDLDQLQPPLSGAVRWYCDAALKEAGTTQGLGGSLPEHEAGDRANDPAGPVPPSPAA